MIKYRYEYEMRKEEFEAVMSIVTVPVINRVLNSKDFSDLTEEAMELSEYEIEHGLVDVPSEKEMRKGIHMLLEGVHKPFYYEQRFDKMLKVNGAENEK